MKRRNNIKWVLGAVVSLALAGFGYFAIGADSGAASTASTKAAMPSLAVSHSLHAVKPFKGRGDKCVEPTPEMRRNHMEKILDQRDKTVRKGIRTKQYRLSRCINCHADPKTNSVLGKNGFCQHCHEYTAVKMDCFTCHNHKASAKVDVK